MKKFKQANADLYETSKEEKLAHDINTDVDTLKNTLIINEIDLEELQAQLTISGFIQSIDTGKKKTT